MLLEHKANINSRSYEDFTSVILAATNGVKEGVELALGGRLCLESVVLLTLVATIYPDEQKSVESYGKEWCHKMRTLIYEQPHVDIDNQY